MNMAVKTHLLTGIKLSLVTLLMFGIAYPLLITGLALFLGPNAGRGKEVMRDGKVVGFELIGQRFVEDRYFQGRPSAVDYNAAATGGSNKGPTNSEYLATVQSRIDTLLKRNPSITLSEIPADLVTASGSGLDPHLSPAAALIQVPRIARTRDLSEDEVCNLVLDHIEGPWAGLAGPSRVNVLKLNVALDELDE